jgi:hypothetical protein
MIKSPNSLFALNTGNRKRKMKKFILSEMLIAVHIKKAGCLSGNGISSSIIASRKNVNVNISISALLASTIWLL